MINITKCLFSLSLLLVSSVTPAALLQFDLYASAADGSIAPSPPTQWLRHKPVPTTLHVSFLLDTLSAKTTTYTLAPDINDPSQSCLGHFGLTGLKVSDLSIQTDRGALWSSDKVKGDLSGDNAGGSCPGGFFAALGFSKGGKSFIWSFDPSPGLSQADIESSTDPLATLLLGFNQPFSGSNLALKGGWGTLFASPVATVTLNPTATVTLDSLVTITAVPLPNAIALFASGFVGLAWKACRRGVARVAT